MTSSLEMHQPVKKDKAKKIINTLAQLYSAWYIRDIPNQRGNHLLVQKVLNKFIETQNATGKKITSKAKIIACLVFLGSKEMRRIIYLISTI